MNRFFTWLMVLGVFAGCWTRVLAIDPCDTLLKAHAQEHSHHDHDHDEPCDPAHDPHCPVDHHHQGGCGHAQPMVADVLSRIAPGPMHFSLSPMTRECCLKPDEPVHDLDKPPLV